MKKVFWLVAIVIVVMIMITGCSAEADVASVNLSRSADAFEVNRRIVFYNSITDSYILVVEGLCSLGNYDSAGELSVTCKVGHDQYVKHFLGLSDNVTYFAEQVEASNVSGYNYRVIFRPETIIPAIELDLSP